MVARAHSLFALVVRFPVLARRDACFGLPQDGPLYGRRLGERTRSNSLTDHWAARGGLFLSRDQTARRFAFMIFRYQGLDPSACELKAQNFFNVKYKSSTYARPPISTVIVP